MQRDLDRLSRHLRSSANLGMGLIGMGCGGYILGIDSMAILGVLGIIPLIRAAYVGYTNRRVVSSIWIGEDMHSLEIVYGPWGGKVDTSIGGIKGVETHTGEVTVDVLSDSGEWTKGLRMLTNPRGCAVEDKELLSAVLEGDKDKVKRGWKV